MLLWQVAALSHCLQKQLNQIKAAYKRCKFTNSNRSAWPKWKTREYTRCNLALNLKSQFDLVGPTTCKQEHIISPSPAPIFSMQVCKTSAVCSHTNYWQCAKNQFPKLPFHTCSTQQEIVRVGRVVACCKHSEEDICILTCSSSGQCLCKFKFAVHASRGLKSVKPAVLFSWNCTVLQEVEGPKL